MATAHCLEMGGEHVAPDHLRLALLCGENCGTSAKFLMSNSDLHKEPVAFLSRAAPIARMTAKRLGDMDECVDVCRACANPAKKLALL